MLWKRDVQRHEVGVDDEVVGKVFLHGPDHFMVVGLGETFERRLSDYIAEVQNVFPILGLSQLVDQELDRVGRRPDEAQAAQMPHLFP